MIQTSSSDKYSVSSSESVYTNLNILNMLFLEKTLSYSRQTIQNTSHPKDKDTLQTAVLMWKKNPWKRDKEG